MSQLDVLQVGDLVYSQLFQPDDGHEVTEVGIRNPQDEPGVFVRIGNRSEEFIALKNIDKAERVTRQELYLGEATGG